MTRKRCGARLELFYDMVRDVFVCDRKRRHDGRHRERVYGADADGQFAAVVRWRRHKDRRA